MSNEPDRTEFMKQCIAGNLDELKKLYESIKNEDQKKLIGERYVNGEWDWPWPLMAAVYYEASSTNLELITWLIETCGADPNLIDYSGGRNSDRRTALHWAIDCENEVNNIEVIAYLLDVDLRTVVIKSNRLEIEKNKPPRKGKKLTLESINRKVDHLGITALDLAYRRNDDSRLLIANILHSETVGALASLFDENGNNVGRFHSESVADDLTGQVVIPKPNRFSLKL
jgi:hypothetical protein